MIDVDMKILIARKGKRIRMWYTKKSTAIYVSFERIIPDLDPVVVRYGGQYSKTFSDAYPVLAALRSEMIDATERSLIDDVMKAPYEYFD